MPVLECLADHNDNDAVIIQIKGSLHVSQLMIFQSDKSDQKDFDGFALKPN